MLGHPVGDVDEGGNTKRQFKVEVKAKRKIMKGEEITTRYLPVNQGMNHKKKKKNEKSWKFFYILTKQFKPPFNLTIFFFKNLISRLGNFLWKNFPPKLVGTPKKTWKFVYILTKQCKTSLQSNEFFAKFFFQNSYFATWKFS